MSVQPNPNPRTQVDVESGQGRDFQRQGFGSTGERFIHLVAVDMHVTMDEDCRPIDIETAPTELLLADRLYDDEDTNTTDIPLPNVITRSIRLHPKRRTCCFLIILLSTFVVMLYSSFFWLTLIDALKLYEAGNDIYDTINLDETPSKGNTTNIPRLIHRMWSSDEFLQHKNLEITRNFNRCINLYKEKWTTILWTDESIRNWMQTYYPHFISLYDAYPYHIQRVDAARYYMDMDIGCFRTKDIGDIVTYMEKTGKQVALPQTHPFGLSNDVMIASKHNPFFQKAIEALPTKNRWFGIHYLTVLFSTGSLFLSLLYFKEKPLERRQIAIIPPKLYSKRGTRYFLHFPGSTWHGKVDQWIVRYWFAFAIVLFFIMLLSLWIRLRPFRFKKKQSKLKK